MGCMEEAEDDHIHESLKLCAVCVEMFGSGSNRTDRNGILRSCNQS